MVLVHSEPNGSLRTVTPADLPPASSVELLDVDAQDRAWLRLRKEAEEVALIDRHGRVIARDGLPPGDRTFAVDSAGRLAVAERVQRQIDVRLYVPPTP